MLPLKSTELGGEFFSKWLRIEKKRNFDMFLGFAFSFFESGPAQLYFIVLNFFFSSRGFGFVLYESADSVASVS